MSTLPWTASNLSRIAAHITHVVTRPWLTVAGVVVAITLSVWSFPSVPNPSWEPALLGLAPWIVGKYVLCPLRWHPSASGRSRRWHLRGCAESELLGLASPAHLGADLWRMHRLQTGATMARRQRCLGPRRRPRCRHRLARHPGPVLAIAHRSGNTVAGLHAALDLKGTRPGLAPAVAKILLARVPGVPVTVCTKEWETLGAFEPVVRRVLSVANRKQLAGWRRRLVESPAYGVSVRLRLLTPELVAELHTRVEVVMAWPVDTPPALAQARRLGVDAVISKDLGLLAGVIADR